MEGHAMSAWDTFVLLGGGPSLTVEDVEYVRDRARVIAINDAYRLAPWAFALWASDKKWIDWHDGAPGFKGLKYSIESRETTDRPGWTILRNTGIVGLETEPKAVRTGYNGGYQAINLAYHLGAKRILLLGFDMKGGSTGDHWFGYHPDKKPSPYAQFIEAFDTIVQPLKDAGVEVINCTPHSALTCFQSMPLRDAFQIEVAA
jgi:hypothetical protein